MTTPTSPDRPSKNLLDRLLELIEANPENGSALIQAISTSQEGAELRRLTQEVERLRGHILDIDAHATPYGDIPGDPGWVGTYLVTAGALHRALGKIGHTAPSCQAEAENKRLLSQKAETVEVLEKFNPNAYRYELKIYNDQRVKPLLDKLKGAIHGAADA